MNTARRLTAADFPPDVFGVLRAASAGSVKIGRQDLVVINKDLSKGALDRDVGTEAFGILAAVDLGIDVSGHVVVIVLVLFHLVQRVRAGGHGLGLHRFHRPAVRHFMIKDSADVLFDLNGINGQKFLFDFRMISSAPR